jgi:hypothetical protein
VERAQDSISVCPRDQLAETSPVQQLRKQSLAKNPDDAIVNKNSNCFYDTGDPGNSVVILIEEDGDDHNDDVRIDALDADCHMAIERYKRAGQ